MNRNDHIVFLVGALLAVGVTSARADYLRCKGDLVDIGDSKGTVLGKCGQPMAKDSFCKPGTGVPVVKDGKPATSSGTTGSDSKGVTINVIPCEMIDEWTYNPGSGQFYTTLRFEQGTLKSMTYGGRVP